MKIEHHIEIDGITCSLSFEASPEALQHLLSGSKNACEDEELEELLLQQSPQIPQMLAEARKLFYLNLTTSYSTFLCDSVNSET